MESRFPKTWFDEYEEVSVLKNDSEISELHKKWWGGENIEITKEMLEALLDGKALGWDDGEYSHVIALSTEAISSIKGE
ncbi:hypothetical protein ACVRY7_07990 [Streptococcus ictaluri]|uniref:Uncharacterized protein n=1 Tax=Streptococcus ictaluri 707-05 TaxID=764299 RepID=G5K0H5_9STRE|nr:hypothetical protein [Streptococcus ictaluri]EHI70624.1 hypothetical protein STRIC_0097 [Streptococcus ictaluri 707-05]